MFDIGFWELLLIGIVTLVVVGPHRLPEVARTAGVYVAKLRRFVAGVKSDINSELETGELQKILGDQRDQIRELKDMVDTTRREIETTTSAATDSVSNFSSSMESQYEEMATKAAQETPTGGNVSSITSHRDSDLPSSSVVDTETSESSAQLDSKSESKLEDESEKDPLISPVEPVIANPITNPADWTSNSLTDFPDEPSASTDEIKEPREKAPGSDG